MKFDGLLFDHPVNGQRNL